MKPEVPTPAQPADCYLAAAKAAIAVRRSCDPGTRGWTLYNHVYAGAYRGEGPPPVLGLDVDPVDIDFIARLTHDATRTAKVHCEIQQHFGQWTQVLVGDGVRAFASRNEIESSSGSSFVWTGGFSVGASPGFVSTSSQLGQPAQPLSRIYLNSNPEHARAYLVDLPERFDAAGVTYQIKTLSHPVNYFRRDSTVIYVHLMDLHRTLAITKAFDRDRGLTLQPGVPLFTQPEATGLGIADDPSRSGGSAGDMSLSHGMLVCHWLEAASMQSDSPEVVAHEIRRAVLADGRDPLTPWARSI